jgi:hypothetical protein
MKWIVGLLAVAVASTAAAFARRGRQEHLRVARATLNRWEDEGGAVPADEGRTAAQTRAGPLSA